MVQNHRNIFAVIRIRLKKNINDDFRAEFRIRFKKLETNTFQQG